MLSCGAYDIYSMNAQRLTHARKSRTPTGRRVLALLALRVVIVP
jgi:hypothetical protein